MKVIILAAESKNDIDENKPKCLLELNGTTVLEKQLHTLSYALKIDISDIIVCIGKRGKIWNNENKKKIESYGVKIIENFINDKTKTAYSLYIAIQNLNENVIVLDGDLLFHPNVINILEKDKENNLFLVKKAPSISFPGSKIIASASIVKRCGTKIWPDEYPWYIYSGICKLSINAVKWFQKLSKEYWNIEIIDVINQSELEFKIVDETNLPSEKILTGGSFANLKVETIVRKKADEKGREKLINEITWLNSIEDELKPYFIPIIKHQITKKEAWFEMPHYDLPTLRDIILTGEINFEEIKRILKKILDFMFDKVYLKVINPESDAKWVHLKHYDRVNKRINDLYKQNNIFKKIIEPKYINVNGNKYRNISECMNILISRPQIAEEMKPSVLRMVHGDLHFQNILIDLNKEPEFILSDPRGELNGADLYYDLGKIWHSCNALYDFIHTDMFEVNYKFDKEINLEYIIFNKERQNIYSNILNFLRTLLPKYELIKRDLNWEKKILFSEAMHLASVSLFHIKNDGKEKRAIMLYAMGVILLNEFIDKYNILKLPAERTSININVKQDYYDAQKFAENIKDKNKS